MTTSRAQTLPAKVLEGSGGMQSAQGQFRTLAILFLHVFCLEMGSINKHGDLTRLTSVCVLGV
jgi:hypothetical protein